MTQYKYNIKITQQTKTKGSIVLLVGQLHIESNQTPHNVAATLFAMEFASNNHSEIPMRVHIEAS